MSRCKRYAASLILPVALSGGGAAAGRPSAPAAVVSEIVLGSEQFAPDGIGWGTAHPRVIYNGGVPNGKVWKLSWSRWGRRVTAGRGLTWIYRPHGGYFGQPGAIELRAYGIGQCSAGGRRAYRHLRAREAVRPGGPFGRWFTWAGQRTLCRWS
jgi:hypothetical protein